MIGRALAALALSLALGAGCAKAPIITSYVTPDSPTPLPTNLYPTEVDYQLLGLVEGNACEDLEVLEKNPIESAAPLEPGMGHPWLYQAAKYDALTKAPDADNLTSIRVKVTQEGDRQCVTLTGRAYRVTGLRSRSAGGVQSGGVQSGGGATTLLLPVRGSVPGIHMAKGGAGDAMRSRGVLMVGPVGGLQFTAAYTRQIAMFAVEFGARADTNLYRVGPMVGVLAGSSYGNGRFYSYGGIRSGYSLGGDSGPMFDFVGGTDVLFGAFGVRAETGATMNDGNVGLAFNLGPIVRF